MSRGTIGGGAMKDLYCKVNHEVIEVHMVCSLI